MKFLYIVLILHTVLFSSEADIVRDEEIGLFTQPYKDMAHKIYEIKKMQEELIHIHKNIAKVKLETSLKEKKANALLGELSKLPLFEVIMLNQQSISLQAEQSLYHYKTKANQFLKKDIDIILEQ